MSAAVTRDEGSDDTTPREGPPGGRVVLILSSDAVAAALIGGLVETLGYLVRFHTPPERPAESLRRQRPRIAMIDCADPTVMNEEVLGPAKMRGISVVVFGTADALRQVRELGQEYEIQELMLPASLEEVDETLRTAAAKC